MTLDEAREHWADDLQPDGGVSRIDPYVRYNNGEYIATLDGIFSADDLEALAIIMRAASDKDVSR